MSNSAKEVKAEEKVTISVDDAKNIREFFKHFNISWPESMEKTVAAFEKEQTYRNQEALKQAMCTVIAESEHDAFNDKMFAAVKTQSTEIAYRAQFDSDLEDVLTEEQKAALKQS